jgi:hypothetical protein
MTHTIKILLTKYKFCSIGKNYKFYKRRKLWKF